MQLERGARNYVYGFNGKEKDESGEWGSLTHYDYGFRIYNPGIARFLSVDPLFHSYPWYTPYQFAGNKPIKFFDADGLEEAVYDNYYGRGGVLTKWTDNLYTYSVAINSSQTAHYLSEDGKPFEVFDVREGASGEFFGRHPMYMFTSDFPFDPNHSIDKDRLLFFTAPFKSIEDVKDYLPANAAASTASRVAQKSLQFGQRLAAEVAKVKGAIKTGAQATGKRAVEFLASEGDNILGGSFKYGDGKVVDFLAKSKVNGNTIEFTDAIFYPKGVSGNELKNAFGGSSMRETLEALSDYAKSKGFKKFRLQFQRAKNSSSAKPGKVFDQTFDVK